MWLQWCLVRGNITVTAALAAQASLTNFAPFTKCITKLAGTIIDVAEDLDLVMPMYSLTECSWNYSETTGSLWFYSKDEATDFNNNIANTDGFKSFKYKAKSLGIIDQPNPNNANGIQQLQNYMFLSSLYQQKIIKNCQNVLAKDLKDTFIGMNIKQKVRVKIKQMNIFSQIKLCWSL